MRRARSMVLAVASAALLAGTLAACSDAAESPLCSGRVSVADFVVQFGQGMAEFDDSTVLDLQANSVSVLDVLLAARDSDPETKSAAESLSAKLAAFIAGMNAHDWIISDALDDDAVGRASDALATEDSLRQANTVEALVLRTCPAAVTVAAPEATYDTLPSPSVPSPTATDPPASGQKDASQEYALGQLIGNTFGITMTPVQVQCVGTALSGVTDATGAQAGPGQYSAQYQRAFDDCGVDFTVPGS